MEKFVVVNGRILDFNKYRSDFFLMQKIISLDMREYFIKLGFKKMAAKAKKNFRNKLNCQEPPVKCQDFVPSIIRNHRSLRDWWNMVVLEHAQNFPDCEIKGKQSLLSVQDGWKILTFYNSELDFEIILTTNKKQKLQFI